MSLPFLAKNNHDNPAKTSASQKNEVVVAPIKNKKEMLLGSKTQGASLSWELVRHPWFTEKALRGTAGNKYVFRVAPHANKTEIKKLFERGYGVTVVAVNMVHIPPKTRKTRGGKTSEKPGYKKAVITLAAGDKLEFATQ